MPEKDGEPQEPQEPTFESVGAEAESAAIAHTLKGLEDVPEDPKELATLVRENVPGLDDASDEDVIAAYKKTVSGEEEKPGEVKEVTKPSWVPEGYKFFNPKGEAHELTPEQVAFLSEIQIGYRAVGKDHMRGFNDVVRNASRGHFNQNQTEQAQRDNERLSTDLVAAQDSVKSYDSQKAEWDRILEAAFRGQTEPFLQAVQAYANAISAPVDPRLEQYRVQIAQMEADKEGERVVQDEVRPYLQDLAKQFNIPTEQYQKLEDYALDKIGQIPDHLATAERIANYLQVELLGELESMGYSEGGQQEAVVNSPAASLAPDVSKQLAAMSAEIENLKNTAAATTAAGGPPGSLPGGAGSGSEDVVPKFKTAQEAWEILRS